MSAVSKLGKDVEKIEEAVYVSPEHQTKEDVEFPEVDAQLANSHEERLCEGLEPEYVLSCKAVAQIYGLENINSIVASAPDLLCEQLVSCRTSSAKKGRKLLTHEQVLTVLGDAIVTDDQLPSSDVLTQADPGVAGGVMGMMTSLFKLRMQSQMMYPFIPETQYPCQQQNSRYLSDFPLLNTSHHDHPMLSRSFFFFSFRLVISQTKKIVVES